MRHINSINSKKCFRYRKPVSNKDVGPFFHLNFTSNLIVPSNFKTFGPNKVYKIKLF